MSQMGKHGAVEAQLLYTVRSVLKPPTPKVRQQ
jgi:hypothetical protein